MYARRVQNRARVTWARRRRPLLVFSTKTYAHKFLHAFRVPLAPGSSIWGEFGALVRTATACRPDRASDRPTSTTPFAGMVDGIFKTVARARYMSRWMGRT